MAPDDIQADFDNEIEAGSETTGSDAASSILTDTTSVTSSVFDYVYENGRRYHSYRAGKYVIPNDEQEQERLDMMHHCWNLLGKGEIFSAPLENPQKVLDVGTGTGIWAMDFGDLYPDSEVIGIDLSPIQPQWVPPNVKFEVEDVEDKWTYEKDSFDYVHSRAMIGSIKSWDDYAKSVFEHLKPGGYFELRESDSVGSFSEDGTYKFTDDFAFAKYSRLVAEAAEKTGRRLDLANELTGYLEKAGFVDVVHLVLKWPIGEWPKKKSLKDLGRFGVEVFSSGIDAYGLVLLGQVLGMPEEEVKQILEQCKKDFKNKEIHMIHKMHVVYGRKPLSGQS